MLVNGSDLGFVAAAVQSWSLPQIHHQKGASPAANKYVGLSVACLLAAVVLSCVQELVVRGLLLGKLILFWLAVEAVYFAISHRR